MLSCHLREMDSSSGKIKGKEVGEKKKKKGNVETGQRVVLNSFVLIETSSHPL